jgi:hypothetical protein
MDEWRKADIVRQMEGWTVEGRQLLTRIKRWDQRINTLGIMCDRAKSNNTQCSETEFIPQLYH